MRSKLTPIVDSWFERIASASALSGVASRQIHEDGVTIVDGPFGVDESPQVAEAYDSALASVPEEVRIGSATTRLGGLLDRAAAFDPIIVHPPLLAAAALIIGEPFRLSSLHARTLLPHRAAPPLHVDCAADARGWPLASFILMIDDFTSENGATRFLPGSHKEPRDHAEAVPACGKAGAMILYNGSVLHEHGANLTDRPRRSIQGAFIRRSLPPAVDFRASLKDETRARLGPLAKYLLDLE